MDIAIVAATDLEITPLREMTLPYTKGKIILTTTGVGSIPTSFSITKLIAEANPQLIIQIGIAGTFNPTFSIGTTVAISSEIMADMGVYEDGNYVDVFQMGLTPYDSFPYEKGCLNNPHINLLENTAIRLAKAVSVNEISTNAHRIDLFKERYGADVESMEGAAFHYTCLCSHTPFIQLRGISNFVGVRDKKQWNIPLALTSVRSACISLLELL